MEKTAKDDSKYKDSALRVDGVHIKSGLVYNKSKGNFEGYVNFGENIIDFDPDKIVTDTLVLMLVGLQGHWQTPIGHVLCTGINARTLSALFKRALHLAALHDLTVHSVTIDGPATNFDAMRNLGCEIGARLEDLKSCFSFDSYNHALYFTLDACHFLKLA